MSPQSKSFYYLYYRSPAVGQIRNQRTFFILILNGTLGQKLEHFLWFLLEKLKKTRTNTIQNSYKKVLEIHDLISWSKGTQIPDKSFVKRANRRTLLGGF